MKGEQVSVQLTGVRGPMTVTFELLDDEDFPPLEAVQEWYTRHGDPTRGQMHLGKPRSRERYAWCKIV